MNLFFNKIMEKHNPSKQTFGKGGVIRGNHKLKDAIIFNTNEDGFTFANKGKLFTIQSRATLPSKMPYDNLYLEYKGSHGAWFIAEECNGKYVIVSTTFGRCLIPEPSGGYRFLSVGYYFNEDLSLYAIKPNTDALPVIEIKQDIIHYNEEEYDIKLVMFAMSQFFCLENFLTFLSCKNVTTKDVHIDTKLQKKRKKKGKLPLAEYKELLLLPTKHIGKSNIPQHLWANRVHLCRGHMREYSPEKPLFGKFSGRFWIAPHARGDKEKGMVVKDYKLCNA